MRIAKMCLKVLWLAVSARKRAYGQTTVKNKQVNEVHFDISEKIRHIRFNLKVRKFSSLQQEKKKKNI